MAFKREDYYGIDFRWFCRDRNGMIAELVTGYGYIPPRVFADRRANDRLVDYIDNLAETSGSELSHGARKRRGDFTLFLKKAEKGLFVYDYREQRGPYERIAIPTQPLSVDAVPHDIKKLLNQTTKLFSAAEQISFT